MSINANYVATPKSPCVAVALASTARDGTSGTLYTLYTAASNGSRIDDISIEATGNTTAGMLRFYIFNGTTHFLIMEVPVIASTPTSTTKAFSVTLSNLSLVLQGTYLLKVSSQNAESFHVVVTRGGDF